MWNRDGRNSALDRAQALLSGKKNDANATKMVNRLESNGPEAHSYGRTVSIGFLVILGIFLNL